MPTLSTSLKTSNFLSLIFMLWILWSLKQISKMRKMYDMRNFEKTAELKKIQAQFAPPPPQM